jgi:hypothetical protein
MLLDMEYSSLFTVNPGRAKTWGCPVARSHLLWGVGGVAWSQAFVSLGPAVMGKTRIEALRCRLRLGPMRGSHKPCGKSSMNESGRQFARRCKGFPVSP